MTKKYLEKKTKEFTADMVDNAASDEEWISEWVKCMKQHKNPSIRTMKMRESNARLGGKPSNFKPEYCNDLIKHMSKGGTIVQWLGSIGIHRGTFQSWTERYDGLKVAKEIGKVKYQTYWEGELAKSKKNIEGYENEGDFEYLAPRDKVAMEKAKRDTVVLTLKTQCRDDWAEKIEVKADDQTIGLLAELTEELEQEGGYVDDDSSEQEEGYCDNKEQ